MREQRQYSGLVAQSQTAMDPFELLRPRSSDEALSMWRDHPDATLAAGCTDLMARVREGLAPSIVIALPGVQAWQMARWREGVLRLGPLMTHRDGPRDTVVQETLPALADAWRRIATVRIRFRATVGGNIMARRYRYEMPIILGALGAELELHTVAGRRRAPVGDIWSAAEPVDGLLHGIAIPTATLRHFAYERSMRPVTTVALAVRDVATGLELCCAVGSEYRAPVIVRLHVEDLESLDPAETATELASALPDWIADYAGSAIYRRRLVATLLRRQLTQAARAAAG